MLKAGVLHFQLGYRDLLAMLLLLIAMQLAAVGCPLRQVRPDQNSNSTMLSLNVAPRAKEALFLRLVANGRGPKEQFKIVWQAIPVVLFFRGTRGQMDLLFRK